MDIRYDVILVRELLHLTQSEVAKELGVSFETVNHWETGKHDIGLKHQHDLYSYAYSHG